MFVMVIITATDRQSKIQWPYNEIKDDRSKAKAERFFIRCAYAVICSVWCLSSKKDNKLI